MADQGVSSISGYSEERYSSEVMLSEILQKAGYRTGIAGKWHLGTGDHTIPINRGFDYQYGFYEAYSLHGRTSHKDVVNQRHKDFSDPFIWGKGRSGVALSAEIMTLLKKNIISQTA